MFDKLRTALSILGRLPLLRRQIKAGPLLSPIEQDRVDFYGVVYQAVNHPDIQITVGKYTGRFHPKRDQ